MPVPSKQFPWLQERRPSTLDTCLSCGACIETCLQGAISDVWLPVPVKTAAVQPVKSQTAAPVLSSSSESRLARARPLLSLVGREIVLCLADSFVAALDRRLSASPGSQVTFSQETVRQETAPQNDRSSSRPDTMEKRNVLPSTFLYASVAIMVAPQFLLPVVKVIPSPLNWLAIVPFVYGPHLYYRRRAHACREFWPSLERLRA